MRSMRSAGASASAARIAELDEIEREIDRLLLAQRKVETFGEQEPRDVVAVNVAAHRLENLIHDRRLLLATQQEGEPRQQAPVLRPSANSFDLCQTSGILATGWSPRQLEGGDDGWLRQGIACACVLDGGARRCPGAGGSNPHSPRRQPPRRQPPRQPPAANHRPNCSSPHSSRRWSRRSRSIRMNCSPMCWRPRPIRWKSCRPTAG